MIRTVGYTTMTADMLHKGHINILKTASELCDVLIVGLTTDTLAKEQKRECWFPFEHRKSILEAIKYVDVVVEHNGQTKSEAHEYSNFDSLFIGDDYYNTDEYSTFSITHPNVKVYYIPRTSNTSSSQVISRIEDRLVSNIHVLSNGVGGPITCLNLDRRGIVMKYINIGYTESTAIDCSDVYNISSPLPRNWKRSGEYKTVFPQLTGINSYREIEIQKQISNFEWNPFISFKSQSHTTPNIEDETGGNVKPKTNLEIAQFERLCPAQTYQVTQRFCGKTLVVYINEFAENHTRAQVEIKFSEICSIIRLQIEQLRNINIIHGDLHPGNICIDKHGTVSFIDFGWCLSQSFNLDENEHSYLEECLRMNFDWSHFIDSLRVFKLDIYFMPEL